MKLIFATHPSLGLEAQKRTVVEADKTEKLSSFLSRAHLVLSLWLSPVGGSLKEWVVLKDETIKVDICRFSPDDLHLEEGAVLLVNLEERVPENPLDTTETQIMDILGGECMGPNVLPCSALTEAEVLHYENLKNAAMRRADRIAAETGITVSYKKMLHDEAVDDYDDYEESGGYYDGEEEDDWAEDEYLAYGEEFGVLAASGREGDFVDGRRGGCPTTGR